MARPEGCLVRDHRALLSLHGIEEVDKVELALGILGMLGVELGEGVGWQGAASGDLDQGNAQAVLALIGAVGPPDQLGADQGVIGGEVEVEVVGLAGLLEGVDDRLGLGEGREAGAEGDESSGWETVSGEETLTLTLTLT